MGYKVIIKNSAGKNMWMKYRGNRIIICGCVVAIFTIFTAEHLNAVLAHILVIGGALMGCCGFHILVKETMPDDT